MNWKRHTFVDVSDVGRERILTELAGCGRGSAMLREKFGRILLPEKAGARVPGIVRREEGAGRSGCVPVGFSQPLPTRKERLRLAAFARLEDVVATINPYEIISLPVPRRTPSTRALSAAKVQAEGLGLRLGVWGSAAMELYTGLPCTRKGSDLDLIVATASYKKLSRLMLEIKAIEERFSLSIDMELDLPNGYGVQLKELMGKGRMVLGKSISGVALFPRSQIAAQLPDES